MKSSINQLAVLTGFDRRTVSRRLKTLMPEIDGKSHLYESTDALPLLYGHHIDGERLDLSQERAALAREQRRVMELKRQKMGGTLLEFDVVADRWQSIVFNVRSKLLAMPTKLAQVLPECPDRPAVFKESKRLIYEALRDLAENPQYSTPDDE